MNTETVRSLLLWCGVINYGILIIWWLFHLLAPGLNHRIARLVRLTPETFDAIQYAGILLHKMITILFFLVPYVVLRFLVQARLG